MLGSLKIHLKLRNGLESRNNSLNDRFETIIRFFVSKFYKYISRTARVSSLRDHKSREFVISKCLGEKSAVGDYHACSKSFIDLILKESFLIKES